MRGRYAASLTFVGLTIPTGMLSARAKALTVPIGASSCSEAHDPGRRSACFVSSLALCLTLTQQPSLNLAGGGHRQCVDEFDLLGILVRREMRPHVALDL